MTDANGEQTFTKQRFLVELTIVVLVFIVAVSVLCGAAYCLIVVRAQIAPGDTLSLEIEGFPDLSGVARVDGAGHIRVREIGMVRVSGMSAREAEALIAELLGGAMRTMLEVRVEKRKP
ncbi:MAG: polysaccharide biosynthesis/export family protein [Candidatus Hydrogenedentes bacterium]|nr:polysaccharide biosynthesis/export family protein [Candidatus Hydrogenedentota bacterium]